MAAPAYTRETQFGAVELPPVRTLEEGMKMPSLTWIAAEEDGRGLAFFSKGVPINQVRGGEIFCTLLRSVSVLSADGISGPLIPTPGAMELGKHTYQYSVYPYQGTWKSARIPREAACFGEGIVAFQVDRLPTERELETFSLAPDNLIVTALKKAEKEEALILRFFEANGEACRARLKLPDAVRDVARADLLERTLDEGAPLERKGRNLEVDVRPFEIVTLKLRHRDPAWAATT
jgi:alpha-mannosidase